jgi:hypothetical protein
MNRTLQPKFPIRWLTYKRRIQLDLQRAFKERGANSVFSSTFVENISTSIRRAESRIIKLISLQFAIALFFVVGFLSSEQSISIFGVSLNQVPGLKEVLLAVYATVAAATMPLITIRDTKIFVLEKIAELRDDKAFLPFTKLQIASAFDLNVYLPRQYEDWIFPALFSRLFFAFLSLIVMTIILCALGVWIILFCLVYRAIYLNPSLGVWSYLILTYSCLCVVGNALWAVRFNLPLPYRDKSDLKRMMEIKDVDPIEHQRLFEKLFGRRKELGGE